MDVKLMDKKQGLEEAKKRYEFLRTLAGVSCIITGCVSLIHSPFLAVGLIITGGTIFIDRMWAPILGLICSIPIAVLSSLSLVISTMFFHKLIIDLFHEEFYGLIIFLLSLIIILKTSTSSKLRLTPNSLRLRTLSGISNDTIG